MDYFKHYEKLIERARNRHLEEYTEKHHIWPKCIGGHDEYQNLVSLTPEEHYVAHQLLVKMFPDEHGLSYSAILMTSGHEGKRNNKLYGWLKRKYSNHAKARIGSNNSSYGKSWYHNPETLENGKFLPEDVPEGWIKGRKMKRKETTKCKGCSEKTGSFEAKWCNDCRYNYNRIQELDYARDLFFKFKEQNLSYRNFIAENNLKISHVALYYLFKRHEFI